MIKLIARGYVTSACFRCHTIIKRRLLDLNTILTPSIHFN
jgi:hypothetical protein